MFEAGIFLGAFLLFHVQPLIAKHILPWYGSTPAVWTTCMLFFQTLLVGGYAYAHVLTGRGARRERGIHLAVLVAAVVLCALQWWRWGAPLLPGADWRNYPPDQPRRFLLLMLLVGVGLPYFVLATTNPLLQKWFTRAQRGASPYRLYVLSNFGSLAGLLAYPMVVERVLTQRAQAIFVAGLFLIYVGICWACARRASGIAIEEAPGVDAATKKPRRRDPDEKRPPRVMWLVLSFCGSLMMLAVTNRLCEEVAVVPMLWVLPLTLYLASFMIGFSERKLYSRPLFSFLFIAGSFLACLSLLMPLDIKLPMQIVIHSVLLFAACTICHAELARLKPAPEILTGYYLTISIGGALGGIFVGFVAPLIFRGFWEFHTGIMLAWCLVLAVFLRDKNSALRAGSRQVASAFLICLVMTAAWFVAPPVIRKLNASIGWGAPLLFYSLAAIIALLALLVVTRLPQTSRLSLHRRGWMHAAFATAFVVVEMTLLFHMGDYNRRTLHASRNFFGPLRVREYPFGLDNAHPARAIIHGNVLHGAQFTNVAMSRLPTAYYVEGSGLGMAILNHPRRHAPEGLRIGVVGLGAGTMAAYCRTNDLVKFYEINPAVAELSRGPDPLFTYLRDAPGRVEIALGDGRLELERELAARGSGNFDVLLLDAFSSDAIPIHLLTREAFAMYLQHLRMPDGILAVNIANRFVDLLPVVRAHAAHFGLEYKVVFRPADNDRAVKSRWALLAKDGSLFRRPPFAGVEDKDKDDGREVPWTDDFSNLFSLLL